MSFAFVDTENGYKFTSVERASLAQTKKDAFATCRQHITIMTPFVWPHGFKGWDIRFEYVSPKLSLTSRIKSWFKSQK